MLFLIKKDVFEQAQNDVVARDATGIINGTVYFAKSKSQLRRVCAQANQDINDYVMLAVKPAK